MTNAESSIDSAKNETWLVGLLCIVAAVRVFIYSAACPFFGPVDEDFHFDLIVRYSQGQPPKQISPFCQESIPYLVYYGSLEYLPLQLLPGGMYPTPPWSKPAEQSQTYLAANLAAAQKVRNHEASQPPLYYLLAGGWWRLGRLLNLNDGSLLYSLRFLNLLPAGLMVWLGYLAARMLFPRHSFLRLGPPALLAFLPQSAFYSIQNDVLSPISFGWVCLCLLQWSRATTLRPGLAAFTGLALAATYLTKSSNLPLLAIAALIVLWQFWCLARTRGAHETTIPATALCLGAGVPAGLWMAWMYHCNGDFTGNAAKIRALGWTLKPFADWWHHPIFTPSGMWIYLSGLIGTFWQGELIWHGQPLAGPVLRDTYAILTLLVVCGAAVVLVSRSANLEGFQRQALWIGLMLLLAGVAFLAFLSIIYDFQDCVYPSRLHPYFTSGRLLLGAAVPFSLVFVFGLDGLLHWVKLERFRHVVLGGIILLMLVGESIVNWPLFSSGYNWFHM